MKPVLPIAAALVLVTSLAAAQMPPATGNSTTPAAPPAGMPGSAQTATSARTQIEASGYTNIKELKRRDDGSWQAIATKNDAEVAVVVDTSGSVTQMSR